MSDASPSPCEPTVIVIGERRRGRPRASESRTTLSTWIPSGEYDRLVKMANRRDQSLSALVRDLLTRSGRKM